MILPKYQFLPATREACGRQHGIRPDRFWYVDVSFRVGLFLMSTNQTTCGCDGKIIVWDVSNDEPKQEKVIDGLIPVVTNTECVFLGTAETL